MKILMSWLAVIILALWPVAARTEVPEQMAPQGLSVPGVSTAQPAPVAQPLVREGDYAVKLAQALGIETTDDESQAESMLAAAGVAPKNGWIADYPVTPDMILDLQNDIVAAAEAGRLGLGADEALQALQRVSDQFGLYAEPGNQGDTNQEAYAVNPPPANYGQYSNPTVINNYYDDYGPPVVTYYAPPPDFAYLYAWVSLPFWWYGFYYPGFYILHDFDRVVAIHGHGVRVVSNHVYDHSNGRFFAVDRHGGRFFHRDVRHFSHSVGRSRPGGFQSPAARSGAESILRHSGNGMRRSEYSNRHYYTPYQEERRSSTARPEIGNGSFHSQHGNASRVYARSFGEGRGFSGGAFHDGRGFHGSGFRGGVGSHGGGFRGGVGFHGGRR